MDVWSVGGELMLVLSFYVCRKSRVSELSAAQQARPQEQSQSSNAELEAKCQRLEQECAALQMQVKQSASAGSEADAQNFEFEQKVWEGKVGHCFSWWLMCCLLISQILPFPFHFVSHKTCFMVCRLSPSSPFSVVS